MHTLRVVLAGFMMTSFLPTECYWLTTSLQDAAVWLGLRQRAEVQMPQQEQDQKQDEHSKVQNEPVWSVLQQSDDKTLVALGYLIEHDYKQSELKALRQAILTGDVPAVKETLDKLSVESVNSAEDKDGNRIPLIEWAIYNSKPETAKLLLEKGVQCTWLVKVPYKNAYGETVLYKEENIFTATLRCSRNDHEKSLACVETLLPYVPLDLDMSTVLEYAVKDRAFTLQDQLTKSDFNLGRYSNQTEREKLIADEHQYLPKSVEAQCPF